MDMSAAALPPRSGKMADPITYVASTPYWLRDAPTALAWRCEIQRLGNGETEIVAVSAANAPDVAQRRAAMIVDALTKAGYGLSRAAFNAALEHVED